MSDVRCETCAKPRTNDPTCPRCGSQWGVLSENVVASMRGLLSGILDNLEVRGEGVVRRNGQIVNQAENK